MTSLSALSELVDAAILKDRQIREATAELKAMKDKLIAEAKLRPTLLEDIPDGGQAFEFQGTLGHVARVILPKASLKASVSPTCKDFPRIEKLTGSSFGDLFEKATVWNPVDDFRAKAKGVLTPAKADKLIALVTSKSEPRVSFETKPQEEK